MNLVKSFLLSFTIITTGTFALKCTPDSQWKSINYYDCTKYYNCDNGQLILNKCPEDQKFDSTLNSCSKEVECHEFPAEPPICPPDEADLLLPHESNCTLFYSCTNGVLTIMMCSPGTEFVPEKGICDWISDNGCTSRLTTTTTTTANTTTTTSTTTTTTTPSATTDEPDTIPTTEYETTNPPTETTSTTDFIEESTLTGETTKLPICHNPNILLVPHETDCTKYYFCLSGIPQLYECPVGMEFDPSELNCVNITDYGCFATTTTDTPTTETELPKHPCDDIDIGLVPHEDDCNLYYFCLNGIPQLYRCPDGERFNPITNSCVPKEGNEC